MSELINQQQTVSLPHPVFAWLGQYQHQPWHPWFDHYSEFGDLNKVASTPDMLVVAAQGSEQDALLLTLRNNVLTSHCLILVETPSLLSPYLANGIWGKGFKQNVQSYQLKAQQLKLYFQSDFTYKVLAYLWLHDTRLEPVVRPAEAVLYRYPLLEAFGVTAQESATMLVNLKQSGYLEPEQLINRVRYCSSCDSGHLNYVDVCPKCYDLNIQQQSSLHCFSCGHVGAQATFQKFSSLSCPNCLQQLRHIGVDYDRPIENQICNCCQTLFVDAAVQAECLDCLTKTEVSALKVQNIFSYKLTLTAKALIREGQPQAAFRLAPGEQMPLAQFYWLIDWQNRLAKRHQQQHCILFVQLTNYQRAIVELGEAKAQIQLDALLERLKNVIRVTDACSHYNQDALLMLLPLTDKSQLIHIQTKLQQLQQKQVGSGLELLLKAVTLPAEIGVNVADWLTDALGSAKPL